MDKNLAKSGGGGGGVISHAMLVLGRVIPYIGDFSVSSVMKGILINEMICTPMIQQWFSQAHFWSQSFEKVSLKEHSQMRHGTGIFT